MARGRVVTVKPRACTSQISALATFIFLLVAHAPAADLPVLEAPPPWPKLTNMVTAELTTPKDVRPPMPDQELLQFMERLRRGLDGGRKDTIAHIYQKARVDGHHHLGGTVVCFFPELNVFYIYGDCAQNHLDTVAGPFQGDPRRVLKPAGKQSSPPATPATPDPKSQTT